MKMKKILMLLILAIGLGSFLNAQTKLREVIQSTQTSRVFAVPEGTNFELLSNYDYTKMIAMDKFETKQKYVDKNQYVNVSITYPQKPRWKNDYEFEVGKAELNKTGTKLYDHNGVLLHSEPNYDNAAAFFVESKNITNYGLTTVFNTSISDLAKIHENMGFIVKTSDNSVLSAINDTIELYYDYAKLIVETKQFADTLLQVSDWRQYQKVGNYCIPKIYVLTTYDNLSTGERLQISELTDFLSYKIINEKGKAIVDYSSGSTRSCETDKINLDFFEESQKKNSKIEIYPNPANEFITVELPYFASDLIDVNIINSKGENVYFQREVQAGSNIRINISSLPPGIYILRTGKADKWQYSKFIKQ